MFWKRKPKYEFKEVIDFAPIFYEEEGQMKTAQMFKQKLINIHLVIPDNYQIEKIKLKKVKNET